MSDANTSTTTDNTASDPSPEVVLAFFSAISNGNIAKLRELIASGAVANVHTLKSPYRSAPLSYVQDATTAEFLVRECKVDINAGNINNLFCYQPPLIDAVQRTRNTELVRVLLENGADMNSRDETGGTALHAAGNSGASMMQLLLAHGASISARDNEGKTPLFQAMRYDYGVEGIEALIKAGADVNATDVRGRTAMFEIDGHYDYSAKLEVLIKHGASVQVISNDKETPMHVAAHYGRLETLRYLADQGAPIDVSSVIQYTPLYMATLTDKYPENAAFLLVRGANVHGDPSFERIPLTGAVQQGNLRVAAVLLARGAVFDPSDLTPLVDLSLETRMLSDVDVLELMIQHCEKIIPQDFYKRKLAFQIWLRVVVIARLNSVISELKPLYTSVVQTLEAFLYYAMNWAMSSHDRWVAYVSVLFRLWKWMLEVVALKHQRILLGQSWWDPLSYNLDPRLLIAIISLRNEVESYPSFPRSKSAEKDMLEMQLKGPARVILERAVRNGENDFRTFIVNEIQGSLELHKANSSQADRRRQWRRLYNAALALAVLHEDFIVHGELASRRSRARFAAGETSQPNGNENPAQSKLEAVRWQSLESLQSASNTFASDVFSFGMCILEALSGQVPWGKVSSGVVSVLLGLGRLPKRPEGLQDKHWELIVSMYAKDPAARPETATVAQRLLEFMMEPEKTIY